jgi:hypothetical protein
MTDEIEAKVSEILRALDVDERMGALIERWGNEAVTLVCSIALGSDAGVDPRSRCRAVFLLGGMQHVQAIETVALLVTSPVDVVAVNAIRAAARQRSEPAVERLAILLRRQDTPPIHAVEAVHALRAIGSASAARALEQYSSGESSVRHRKDPVVEAALDRAR